MAIKMIAPTGVSGIVAGSTGQNYTVAGDGTIANVNSGDVLALLRSGWRMFSQYSAKSSFNSPLPADLVSIVSAATPANAAVTIAAQPPHARKLQVRVVIGTTTTTAITAGTLALVGVDQDGNAVSETLSLVANASVTLKTANCYASLTSGTVAGYAASGSGTGNTLGIGLSNDFGIQTAPGVVDFGIVKATKITKVLGTSNVAADDVASTATVDATARSVAPTTAPAASGLVDFEFLCNYSLAA